jgi:hypothetical protein
MGLGLDFWGSRRATFIPDPGQGSWSRQGRWSRHRYPYRAGPFWEAMYEHAPLERSVS